MDTVAEKDGAGRDADMNETSLLVLAKEAGELFKENKFDECLVLLRAIQKRKPDDPKVLHNMAIVEYYREGCSDPEKLLRVFSRVKTRANELKRSVEENAEGPESTVSSSGQAATAGGTVSGTGTSGIAGSTTGGAVSSTIMWTEDYDTAIAAVNTALIYYHLQQYGSASSLLESIFRNIEPIDERPAFWVCLLLLDLRLATRQVEKAATVLAYVEKAFGYLLSPESASASASAPSSAPSPASGVPSDPKSSSSNNGGGAPSSEAQSVASFAAGEDELSRAAMEDGLDEEALNLALEMQGGEEGGRVLGSARSKRGAAVSKALPGSMAEVKQLLHMYKARLLLLTRNLKGAKREVKAAGSVTHDGVQTVFLLKAYLEYCRENHRKCIKVLTGNIPSVINSSNPVIRYNLQAMVLSNLGCVHHRLGKAHLASLYFSQALKCAASAANQTPPPLKVTAFTMDYSFPILYNAGLQQLLHGNAPLAARCFQKCSHLYYNRPLLWLRLAECCVVAYEKGQLEESSGQRPHKKDDQVTLVVVGGGRWRRVVLPAGGLHVRAGGGGISISGEGSEGDTQSKGSGSFSSRSSDSGSSSLPAASGKSQVNAVVEAGQFPKPSLDYGRRCLRNALHLLDKEQAAAAAVATASAFANAASSETKDVESPTQGGGNGSEAGGSSNAENRGSGTGTSMEGSSERQQSAATGREGKAMGSATITANSAALEAEKSHQRKMLRSWALACLSYAELCLDNSLASLSAAQALLALPNCPPSYCFLARMYSAEALCLLDRPTEAAEHLSTCMVEHTSNELPSLTVQEGAERKWRSGDHSEASGDGEEGGMAGGRGTEGVPDLMHLSGPTARASLYVNLAAVYSMQGEVLQAQQCALQALSIAPANPLAMLAVVYVELCRGQTSDALAMLKHCRHICVGHLSKGQVVVGL